MKKLIIPVLLIILFSCSRTGDRTNVPGDSLSSMDHTNKAFARYWWFASEIKKADIRYNLDWLKDHGFGGVELAWVYPLNAMDASLDRSYTPRQQWLSPEWQDIVEYAMFYADSIGLACDLTMGTLWPFGDSYVQYDEASQVYGQEERQKITRSWEFPKAGYVVDHMLPRNYMKYFRRMIDFFPRPSTGMPHSYFIDSWEVETKGLWYDGLQQEFIDIFNYDISPFMDSLYMPGNEAYLYDYMKLISEKVIAFYQNYDSVLNEHAIISRGQCSGAPCDIISAYARLDIPEGEAMLYEPEYNSIPSSAATLSGRNIVSAETFTCMYGWPRHYIREEQAADLKMIADALFANGINHIIWHGKAHNPAGQDSVNFYATVHLGDSGTLAGDVKDFNHYLATVSGFMKKGRPYTEVAVYLPTEDAWMKGIMPEDQQFIWAWAHYEMRYVYFPEILKAYHPTWINREFLEKAVYEDGLLKVGNAGFSYLYVDVQYLDYEALQKISALAQQGLPLTMRQSPGEPGTIKHDDYDLLIREVMSLPNVYSEFHPHRVPLVEGGLIPPFRAREDNNSLYIFFANPASEKLEFPLGYGQSFTEKTGEIKVRVNYKNNKYDIDLRFEPYSSLLYKLTDGQTEEIKLSYRPQAPVVRSLPDNFPVPWLVN
ncbi:MAG: hypothetical protein KFF49_03875 [Bacteroidales bacterium]|nr:hypothetical protein [Bacteroidales bacterium]